MSHFVCVCVQVCVDAQWTVGVVAHVYVQWSVRSITM